MDVESVTGQQLADALEERLAFEAELEGEVVLQPGSRSVSSDRRKGRRAFASEAK
jgi:hypothetical protein